MRTRGLRILPVNIALLAAGLLDMVTTLVWVRAGHAVEFNPIMAALLGAGAHVFVLAKLSTLGAYVLVMEYYRRRRSEVFARIVGSFTFTAYLIIYGFSFLFVNHGLILG